MPQSTGPQSTDPSRPDSSRVEARPGLRVSSVSPACWSPSTSCTLRCSRRSLDVGGRGLQLVALFVLLASARRSSAPTWRRSTAAQGAGRSRFRSDRARIYRGVRRRPRDRAAPGTTYAPRCSCQASLRIGRDAVRAVADPGPSPHSTPITKGRGNTRAKSFNTAVSFLTNTNWQELRGASRRCRTSPR